MSSINCKIYLLPSNLIRRFAVSASDDYNSFDRMAREAFGIINSEVEYLWQYEDEESDWVSFSTDGEWKDAIFYHTQSGSKLFRLRLVKQDRQPERGQRHCRRPG